MIDKLTFCAKPAARLCAASLLLALCALLPGCGAKPAPSAPTSAPAISEPESHGAAAESAPSESAPEADADPADEILALLDGAETRRPVDADFLGWCGEVLGAPFLEALAQALAAGGYDEGLFFELGGQSLPALHDRYTGAAETDPNLHDMGGEGTATVAITGDINLADDWETMAVLREMPGGIRDCIDPALMKRMRAADVLLINNEFSFSDRGSQMPGKQYTFRSATENVNLLTAMGVDLAGLANNHVYDYGEDAFYDTLDTLRTAGIPTVGAGRDIEEAAAPQYFLAGGLKIAFVAASRAEKNILTPEATGSTPGVLRCYDPALFLEKVAEARENADIVIAYPHWGTENTTRLEDVQVELGRQLIEAGADAVVGAHPHVLQGVGWHEGKPIAYSLGNFWFNTNTVDTALLEITATAPGELKMRMVPCLQAGGVTTLLNAEDPGAERILSHLEAISENLAIAPDGTLSQAG